MLALYKNFQPGLIFMVWQVPTSVELPTVSHSVGFAPRLTWKCEAWLTMVVTDRKSFMKLSLNDDDDFPLTFLMNPHS